MRRSRFKLGWWWGAALLVAAVAFWPVQLPRYRKDPAAPEPQPTAATTYLATAVTAPRAQAAVSGAPGRAAGAAVGGETMSGEPAADSGEQHPHPMTPEREALQQELRLVGALQDALDLEDVPSLRSLIARYRAHVPGDENKLAEGYTRLADCLDAANGGGGAQAAREAAAAYYQNERASTLRRYIRRVCLER